MSGVAFAKWFGKQKAGKRTGKAFKEFLVGKPEKNYQQSLLGPEQIPLYNQLQQSAMQRGAGGAFGDSSDYYRDILSNDQITQNRMNAPELNTFNNQIMPSLSNQFSGLGNGGITNQSFQNAAVNANSDLSERLGAIRAKLRGQAAQGFTNIGQQGLGQYNENILRPETGGYLGAVAEGLGGALAQQNFRTGGNAQPSASQSNANGAAAFNQSVEPYNDYSKYA